LFGDWENEEIDGGREKNPGREDQEASRQPAGADTGATGNVRQVWRLHPETGEPRVFFHGSRDDIVRKGTIGPIEHEVIEVGIELACSVIMTEFPLR